MEFFTVPLALPRPPCFDPACPLLQTMRQSLVFPCPRFGGVGVIFLFLPVLRRGSVHLHGGRAEQSSLPGLLFKCRPSRRNEARVAKNNRVGRQGGLQGWGADKETNFSAGKNKNTMKHNIPWSAHGGLPPNVVTRAFRGAGAGGGHFALI